MGASCQCGVARAAHLSERRAHHAEPSSSERRPGGGGSALASGVPGGGGGSAGGGSAGGGYASASRRGRVVGAQEWADQLTADLARLAAAAPAWTHHPPSALPPSAAPWEDILPREDPSVRAAALDASELDGAELGLEREDDVAIEAFLGSARADGRLRRAEQLSMGIEHMAPSPAETISGPEKGGRGFDSRLCATPKQGEGGRGGGAQALSGVDEAPSTISATLRHSVPQAESAESTLLKPESAIAGERLSRIPQPRGQQRSLGAPSARAPRAQPPGSVSCGGVSRGGAPELSGGPGREDEVLFFSHAPILTTCHTPFLV